MTRYLRDQYGVDWPITGRWCSTCGWPLTPIRHGQEEHLGCGVDVLDVEPAPSGLEQTLLADTAAQRSDTPAPPGHRVWVDMPDVCDDGRFSYIDVTDADHTDADLADWLIDPCPICHMRRWNPRTGGYGLYILDANPDPWLFCPFCSASCFCLVTARTGCLRRGRPAARVPPTPERGDHCGRVATAAARRTRRRRVMNSNNDCLHETRGCLPTAK